MRDYDSLISKKCDETLHRFIREYVIGDDYNQDDDVRNNYEPFGDDSDGEDELQ